MANANVSIEESAAMDEPSASNNQNGGAQAQGADPK